MLRCSVFSFCLCQGCPVLFLEGHFPGPVLSMMFARLFFSHGKWNVNIMLNVSFCVFRKKESHTCLDDSSKKNSVKSDSNSSWSFYCDFHLYNMTTDLGVAFFHSLEQSLTDCRIIVSLVLTNIISPDYFKRASVFLWVSLIYQ